MPTRRTLLRHSLSLSIAASMSPLFAEETGRKWTVGVIGDSDRGGYGHGLDTVWLSLPETQIIALADPSETGRKKAVERLQISADHSYADYRQMLQTAKPDLVAIGPRDITHHRDYLLAAIESGAKGIYIEKPYCRDLAEAEQIVKAQAQHGTKIAIAHRNRYHPALPRIVEMVEQGAIGRWLEIRGRGKEDARGGGLDLWVLGSHVLNLTHYFTGKATACSATLLQDGRPATTADVHEGGEGVGPLAGNELHARFETESGIPVFFDSIAKAGVKEANFGLQLVGNAGIIDLRVDIEPLAHYRAGNPFHPTQEATAWQPISSAGLAKPEPIADLRTQIASHQLPARDLIQSIQEDRPPLCSAEDGQIVTEMILAIFESHRRQGARVPLPLIEKTNPLTRL